MRILVICQYYYPEQFRINDICESLVHRGHNVTVLTGLPNYPMGIIPDEYKHGKKRHENINGVEVIRCFEIGRKKGFVKMALNYISYMCSATVKALILKNDYDVVLINQLSPVLMAVPGLVFARKNKLKTLLYSLDIWPESLTAYNIDNNSIIYKVMLKLSRGIYKRADMLAASSYRFGKYFEEIIGIEKEVKYIPQYAEDIFSDIKAGGRDEKCNLLFAGNIGAVQSVETIVEAAQILKDEPDILFHIVGDGCRYEECMKKAEGLNNIIFYGRHSLDEMKEFYDKADAMLITLNRDKLLSYTLPGKMQTYMAAGKPIIGAIDGETKRVIEEAKCGYCVHSGDSAGLAETIRTFNKNRGLWKRFGINALEYYERNFRKEVFISKLEQNLNELLKGVD